MNDPQFDIWAGGAIILGLLGYRSINKLIGSIK